MKKIFFFLSFSMIIAKVNAQILGSTLNNHKVKADLFLLKAKKQKTAGWLVLGGGLALCFVSVANAFGQVNSPNGNYNPSDPPSAKITIEEIMAYGGAAAMLTSIPLFIASGKNKRKAALSFSNGYVPKFSNGNIVYHNIPSLKLKIYLP